MLFPKEVIVEVTNLCNIRCRFCHFHGQGAARKRKLGMMESPLWKKIAEDIESWLPESGELYVLLHGAGEPLLHPEYRSILKRFKEIRGAKVGFMTNGMLLSEEWAKFIVDVQIDGVWFSIDGCRPEINDTYRVGADLRVIERNLLGLIEEKERKTSHLPKVHLNMVLYPGIPEKAGNEFVEKWIGLVDSVSLSVFRPIGSKRLLDSGLRESISYKPCGLLYRQLVVGWDGTVGLCCEDINMEVSLGNLKEKGILDIFNGDEINRIRHLHESRRKSQIPICKDCDVWAADYVLSEEEWLISGHRVKVVKTPAATSFVRCDSE